jgi:FtsP/CotA-like multicopper oxidase with cupredoxin domain
MSNSSLARRDFLRSGITVATATFAGLAGTGCSPDRLLSPRARQPQPNRLVRQRDGDLAEPRVISSVGGALQASITCATIPTLIGGRRALEAVTYDGTFPAPTLWVRPGDTIDLTFANRIVFDQNDTKPGYGRPPRSSNDANLHYHGLHISPVGSADNMLVMVPANGTYRYSFQIPANHPAGLFWYHEHVHGLVTNHVSRGAAGMIYIANAHTDRVAGLGIRRRLMLLQQAYFAPDLRTVISDDGERDDPDLALSLINGALMPDIAMRPGEPQVWCLLNGSTSAFYLLRLEGHTFDVIADDGVPLRAPRLAQPTLMLPSGKRLEVIVRATARAGTYRLSYDQFDQGVDTWPQKSVATVVVDGAAWSGPDHPGVDTSTPASDLSTTSVPPERHRTIVLGVDRSVPEGEFGRFTINGHAWDPAISEWTSTLGTVEEWFIRNDTEQDHPFHVHVNPFQITRIDDRVVPFDGYQDTAIVPRFGSMTVRTRFTDFVGGPVLMHCHILDHEDMGMMTRFEIVPPEV